MVGMCFSPAGVPGGTSVVHRFLFHPAGVPGGRGTSAEEQHWCDNATVGRDVAIEELELYFAKKLIERRLRRSCIRRGLHTCGQRTPLGSRPVCSAFRTRGTFGSNSPAVSKTVVCRGATCRRRSTWRFLPQNTRCPRRPTRGLRLVVAPIRRGIFNRNSRTTRRASAPADAPGAGGTRSRAGRW